MRRLLGRVLLTLGISGQAVLADNAPVGVCPHTTTILALADEIMALRPEMPRLAQRRTGEEALYLQMHYAGMTPGEMQAHLRAQADAGGVAAAADMALALGLATGGVEATLAAGGDVPAGFMGAVGMRHTHRAVLLEREGATYFRLLAAGRADPRFAEPLSNVTLSQGVWPLVADQDDAFKRAFAANAEAAGEVITAAQVAGSMRDLTEYRAILARHPDDTLLQDLAGPAMIATFGPGLVYLQDGGAERQMIRDAVAAQFHSGQSGFMATLYNMTGDDAVGLAAADYLAALTGGTIDPIRAQEAAWAMQYAAVLQAAGPEMRNALGGFDWPTPKVRHYAGRAADTLDWVVAVEAWRPFMSGETDDLPVRPALLGTGFDWAAWVTLAPALRAGDMATGGEEAPGIGVELLVLAGDYAAAADWARARTEPRAREAVLTDLIQRMDRQCDAVTSFPGQALMLGGAILFDMPPMVRR